MSAARHVGRILSACGLPAAIVLAAIAVLTQRTTIGQSANDWLYDRFVQLDARFSPLPADVIVVYADVELERQPKVYLQLLERLSRLDAAAVGVIQLDIRRWTPGQLEQLCQFKSLVLGHVTGDARRMPDSVTRGSITLSYAHDGIHRRYGGLSREARAASLAAVVARERLGAGAANRLPRGEFRVRFRGSAESLPHVSARTVLRDEVPAVLVRHKTVLIGRPADPACPGLMTPTATSRPMSVAEFHGHALNTLMTGRPVSDVGRYGQLTLFVVGALVFVAAGRRLNLRLALPVIPLAWVLQATAGWLVTWWTACWFPLASLLLVEFGAWLWSFDRRLRFCARAWPLLSRQGSNPNTRFRNPSGLRADQPPWPVMMTMLQQLFPLERVALLLVFPGHKRLELATHLGDLRSEALQNLADLQRRPFDEAIHRHTAVRIDRDAPYFAPREDRSQFFVPLFYGEQLKGVLVVELASADLDQMPGFTRQLTDVGAELAAWLSQYQRLVAAAQGARRPWNRLTTSRELCAFNRLQRQLRTLERRLHQTHQVVEQSSVGEAVFDLGGAPVTVNATMSRLLHNWGLGAGECRLLDILQAVKPLDSADCRHIVRRVFIQRRRERLVATDPWSRQPTVLVLQPLLVSDQHADDPTSLEAFKVQGIHLEILSTELLCDIHAAREPMTDRTLSMVLDTLSDVSLLAARARHEVPPQAWHQFSATVRRAQLTVQRCQTLLASGQSECDHVHLPVDVSMMVRAAISETRAIADEWGTVIAVNLAANLPFVAANPHQLRQVIAATIAVLVEHAPENSRIDISATTESNHVILTIENPNCGVALDRLATGRGLVDRPPSEAERLMLARKWLLEWGGDLQLHAELGEGARVQLTLQAFEWSDLREPAAATEVDPCPTS